MPSWSTDAYQVVRDFWLDTFYYQRVDTLDATVDSDDVITNTAAYHAARVGGAYLQMVTFNQWNWDNAGQANYFIDGTTSTATVNWAGITLPSTPNPQPYVSTLRQENATKNPFYPFLSSEEYLANPGLGSPEEDRHAILYSPGKLTEAYHYTGTSATANQVATYDLTDATNPDRLLPTSSGQPVGVVAAKVPVAPFLFTYQDLLDNAGGDLGHMLGWVAANYRAGQVWPARGNDGQLGAGYLKAGQVIRLKSSYNVDAISNPSLKVIARTLKKYGAMLFDKNMDIAGPSTGGRATLAVPSDHTWPQSPRLDTLMATLFPLSDFEVVDTSTVAGATNSIKTSVTSVVSYPNAVADWNAVSGAYTIELDGTGSTPGENGDAVSAYAWNSLNVDKYEGGVWVDFDPGDSPKYFSPTAFNSDMGTMPFPSGVGYTGGRKFAFTPSLPVSTLRPTGQEGKIFVPHANGLTVYGKNGYGGAGPTFSSGYQVNAAVTDGTSSVWYAKQMPGAAVFYKIGNDSLAVEESFTTDVYDVLDIDIDDTSIWVAGSYGGSATPCVRKMNKTTGATELTHVMSSYPSSIVAVEGDAWVVDPVTEQAVCVFGDGSGSTSISVAGITSVAAIKASGYSQVFCNSSTGVVRIDHGSRSISATADVFTGVNDVATQGFTVWVAASDGPYGTGVYALEGFSDDLGIVNGTVYGSGSLVVGDYATGGDPSDYYTPSGTAQWAQRQEFFITDFTTSNPSRVPAALNPDTSMMSVIGAGSTVNVSVPQGDWRFQLQILDTLGRMDRALTGLVTVGDPCYIGLAGSGSSTEPAYYNDIIAAYSGDGPLIVSVDWEHTWHNYSTGLEMSDTFTTDSAPGGVQSVPFSLTDLSAGIHWLNAAIHLDNGTTCNAVYSLQSYAVDFGLTLDVVTPQPITSGTPAIVEFSVTPNNFALEYPTTLTVDFGDGETQTYYPSGDWVGTGPNPDGGPDFEFTFTHTYGYGGNFDVNVTLDGERLGSAAPDEAPISAGAFNEVLISENPDIFLDINPDCAHGGYSIIVSFSENVPSTSTWTLYRNGEYTRSVVRGAKDISVSATGIGSIVDYESPIDLPVTYTLVVSNFDEVSVTVPALIDTCGVPQYLRDLLDPDVSFTSEFCLGVLDSLESNIRSGVYSVLGRPAPIVVVDTRETETGTLRFIAETYEQVRTLRRLFNRGTPMLLQVEHEYLLGNLGVLYFQPTQISDKWLAPNAKVPYHTLEVSFTTIDAPSYTTLFSRLGIPYDVPVTASPGYTVTEGELAGQKYCAGGLRQRYANYTALSNSNISYTQAYYLPDNCN